LICTLFKVESKIEIAGECWSCQDKEFYINLWNIKLDHNFVVSGIPYAYRSWNQGHFRAIVAIKVKKTPACCWSGPGISDFIALSAN